MLPTTMLIIAGVLALVATVLAFIYVVPEKKREKLGAFGKFLHDTCNFKYLMVEKILQALYIFTTAAVIIFGVLMLPHRVQLLDRRPHLDGRLWSADHHPGAHCDPPQL